MQVAERMQRAVVTIGRDDSLSLALQLMGWNNIRHLPVVEEERVVGMISERDILLHTDTGIRGRIDGTVAETMATPVKHVPPDMTIEEAAAILVKERIGALPVVKLGRLVGILSETDVLGYAACCVLPRPLDHEPRVDDVMTRSVEVVYPSDRVTDAAARMRQYGIRHLPVVDGERKVIGMLSDRDVLRATGAELLELGWGERPAYESQVTVDDAMTTGTRTVRASDALRDVVKALVDAPDGAFAVTDHDGHICGVVSYVDLLSFLHTRMS